MSDIWPRLQNLPQDGLLWLLTWLGPFYLDTTVPSQRMMLASISSVKDSTDLSPAQHFGNGVAPLLRSSG